MTGSIILVKEFGNGLSCKRYQKRSVFAFYVYLEVLIITNLQCFREKRPLVKKSLKVRPLVLRPLVLKVIFE